MTTNIRDLTALVLGNIEPVPTMTQTAAIASITDAEQHLRRLRGVVWPPILPLGTADPVSGHAWPRGFGQVSDELAAHETWCGKRSGVGVCWSAFQKPGMAETWTQLCGGPPGAYDTMNGLFSIPGGAYHLHKLAGGMIDRRATLIWVFPLLPKSERNNLDAATATWRQPGVWAKFAGPEKAAWAGFWRDVGGRVGKVLLKHKWPPEQLVLDLGWEFTGSWYWWSLGPDSRGFVDCARRAVDGIRAGLRITHPVAENAVRFQLRFAGEQYPKEDRTWNVASLWPGKDWFSTLGVSAHAHDRWWSTVAGWQMQLEGTPDGHVLGFQTPLEFARAEGVKLGLNEHAVVRSGESKGDPPDPNGGAAVRRFYDFVRANAAMIAHEAWWVSGETALIPEKRNGELQPWGGSLAYLEAVKAP